MMHPNKKKRSKYYGLNSKNIGNMASEVNNYLSNISKEPKLTNQISKMYSELFGESPVNHKCVNNTKNASGVIYNKNRPGFATSTFSSEQHSRPSSNSLSRPLSCPHTSNPSGVKK